VVMEEGANLAQLIGVIEEFYRRLGFTRAKFRPGYFPYTEPSMEPEVQLPDGTWMELGGSGIFRPEVTEPLGLRAPVLAWGLGLERLIIAVEGISDLRGRVLRESRDGPRSAESRTGGDSGAVQGGHRLGRRESAVPGRPRLLLRRPRTLQRRGGTVQCRGQVGRGERSVLLVRVRHSICAEGAPQDGTVSRRQDPGHDPSEGPDIRVARPGDRERGCEADS